MKKIISFLIFTILFAFSSFSQEIEYKEHEFFNKLRQYKDSHNDSLLFYANKMKASTSKCDQMVGMINEAYFLYRKRDYVNAKKSLKHTITKINELIEKHPNYSCLITEKANALHRLFWTLKNQEEYESAYKQLIKISEINTTYNLKPALTKKVNVEISKAYIKYKLGLEEESKKILTQVIKLLPGLYELSKQYPYIKPKTKEANIYNLLGETNLSLGKKTNTTKFIDSASYYFDKAYKLAKEFSPPNPDSEFMYALKKTEILISKKKFNEAIALTDTYKRISHKKNYSKRPEYLNKAICFHNLNTTDSAIFYANRLLRTPELKKTNLITAYDILSNQYVNKNQLDSAYKYSKLTLKEFNEAKEQKQITYQLLYDNDIEKIKELNRSIIQKEKKKNIGIILLAVSVVILISLFFLFKRKNYKKEIETIVTSKNELILKNKEDNTNQKVAYNIDDELEQKIIQEINKIDTDLSFLDQNFTINSISKKLQTNSTYISFVFNKNKKETFKQYYSRKKIEYIVDMLKKNKLYRNYSVQALAEEVGYSNASAFTRVFKKHMNVTPSAYVKSLESN